MGTTKRTEVSAQRRRRGVAFGAALVSLALLPLMDVPMRLFWIVLWLPVMKMPLPEKPLMTSPLMVLSLLPSLRPSVALLPLPLISMTCATVPP